MRPKLLFFMATLVLPMIAIVGVVLSEGRYSRGAFEKTMESSNRNIRVLLGSLIAGDFKKAASTAEELTEEAGEIAQLTPKHSVDRIDEFRAYADSLAVHATRLAKSAKAGDHVRSAGSLGNLVAACTGCHTVFRK
jgi:cytochrome c556